jgi:hypothetical protein
MSMADSFAQCHNSQLFTPLVLLKAAAAGAASVGAHNASLF